MYKTTLVELINSYSSARLTNDRRLMEFAGNELSTAISQLPILDAPEPEVTEELDSAPSSVEPEIVQSDM
tara:strand:- start:83 stop:292 length:210 start_codon:yes stop_codon:yes gene_type:complete